MVSCLPAHEALTQDRPAGASVLPPAAVTIPSHPQQPESSMLADAHVYFWVALAGLVSFLSPCVLPLVPPYLGFLGGTTIEELTHEDGVPPHVWRRVVLASLCFVAGFSTVFMGLGAGASAFGQLIQTYKSQLATVAGLIIILFGLHFLGVFRINAFYAEKRYHHSHDGGAASFIGAYLIGLAFAFGWTPCIGPILTAVLAVAAQEASLVRGVKLLLVYSLGLGIPFVLAAVAIGPFLGFMQRFRKHLGRVEQLMGVLLVITGILFLTGSMNWLGQWLIETFPVLLRVEDAVVPHSLPSEIMKRGMAQ